MKRFILITFLLVFTSFWVQGQITLTTTSSSDSWSPYLVTNTGGTTLTWSAASNGIFLGQIVSADDPTFDFSTNTSNNPIIITVTSADNFVNLTQFDFWNDNGVGSEITDIDVSNATALESLIMRYNRLTTIDISQNTELTNFNIRGNNQLLNQNLNTTANTKLEAINIESSGINNVDFSNNDLLVNVNLYHAHLTTSVLDKVVMDLDDNGQIGGILDIDSNTGQLSYNSYTAFNSLTGKNWTIDVPAPPTAPNTETISFITTSSVFGWQLGRLQNTGLVLHWKAEGSGIVTQEFDENKPSFDFSSNGNGDPITITVTSEDGFDYLVEMSLYLTNSRDSDITDIEISKANNLKYLYPYRSNLNSLNVSLNTELQRLLIHNTNPNINKQLVNQSNNLLDISNSLNLYQLTVNNTHIESLSSLLSNKLIRDINLTNSEFTSAALDQVIIDLDQNGIVNPQDAQYNEHIEISGNPGTLTSASLQAYNNLMAKGWTIDISPHPAATGPEIDIQGGNPLIPIVGDGTNTPIATDNTDFGSSLLATPIVRSFTIENTGDDVLNLTSTPLVAISGADAVDFTVSTLPSATVGTGSSTTFKVTFDANATGTGVKTAILTLDNDGLSGPASYTFNIQAEALALASGAKINVVGNSVVGDSINIPSGNTPIIADGTDFGQVDIGSPITQTFTIQNVGDSDLTLYSISGGGNGFSVIPLFLPAPETIISEGEFTFDVTFTGTLGVQTATLYITSSDVDNNPYIINLTAEGVEGSSGEIEVQGNGVTIVENDMTPDVADDTNFGQSVVNLTETRTYTIINNGSNDLTISNIDIVDFDGVFSLVPLSFDLIILPGQSETFQVEFTPTNIQSYQARVDITHTGSNENNPFRFQIAGEGLATPDVQDIMITQYYDGVNNNKWIEVKNISGSPIAAGTYYLALYDDLVARQGVIETSAPTANIAIPALGIGNVLSDDVVLFRNTSATLPGSGNLGTAVQVTTDVCTFSSGDDVILISTSNGLNCYNNRVDIFGNISSSPSLSPDKVASPRSYIKGGCSSEMAHINFVDTDWTSITTLEVRDADANTNLALGTQVIGSTEFDGSGWTNLASDRSRTAIVTQSFTNASQTVTSCNLIINIGVIANFDSNGVTSNSLVVYQDLVVNGELIIGDTESFVSLSSSANLGSITKIEKSNTLFNLHDATYWSSPVTSAQLSTVFTGVNPDRIFDYRTGDENTLYAGTNYRYWWVSTGAMEKGRGYSVEGPSAPVDGNDDYLTPFQHEVSFVGIPYNGPVQKDIEWNGTPDTGIENENYNLVGNPYPAAVDLNLFLAGNLGVDNIALWTHSTTVSGGNGGEFTDADYVIYNRSGGNAPVTNNLASGQGFMVRSIGDGSVTFLNSQKLIGRNDQFFKSETQKKGAIVKDGENDRIWLRLKGSNVKSDILVGFLKEATDGLDHYFDAKDGLNDKSVRLYSNLDNHKLVIQGMGSFSSEKSVSLGIDIKEKNNLSLSISGMEGIFRDIDVFLVDNALNITHNLKAGDYTFEQTTTGEFPNRFTLQFVGQALDVDDEIFAKNKFIISNEFESLHIRSAKEVKDIKVYDLLGRMLIQKKPNNKSFNLSTGSIKNGTVLLIEATLENGSVVSKKTIKY